jgi:hypothetical protein
LQLHLLEQQVRAGADEGVGWGFRVDNRLDVPEFCVDPAKKIEHLTRLRHRVPDVAQTVGEFLQAHGVVGDAEVALLDGAELDLVVGCPLELVAAEDTFDVALDGEHRGLGLVDDVEDRFGNGGV